MLYPYALSDSVADGNAPVNVLRVVPFRLRTPDM